MRLTIEKTTEAQRTQREAKPRHALSFPLFSVSSVPLWFYFVPGSRRVSESFAGGGVLPEEAGRREDFDSAAEVSP